MPWRVSDAGDPVMMQSYLSGDPYMSFAILAGAAPEGATGKTHPAVRDLYKRAILAMQYGMGYRSLARQLGILPIEASINEFMRYFGIG